MYEDRELVRRMPLGLRPGDKRDILAAKFELINNQTFNMKNLYKYMSEWLIEHGYTDQYVPGNDKFEILYYEFTNPDGSMNLLIWWRVARVPKNNSYFRYVMHIDMQLLGLKKTEIIQEKRKLKTFKGELTLRFESFLQLDYMDKWKCHPILKNFDEVFRNRIYRKNIETYKRELYNESYRFQNFVKHFLNLSTPHKMAKPFHPQLGI